jgi:hypothetical protein
MASNRFFIFSTNVMSIQKLLLARSKAREDSCVQITRNIPYTWLPIQGSIGFVYLTH